MSTRDSPTPARGRPRRIATAVAVLLALGALVLWSVRKPVAERWIDRTLAADGVPARYTLADLGLGRQRLTNVVIGDPAHPDLVADWIETETGIGFSGAELAGVRIGRSRLRARLAKGRVSFGSLDRLLPAASGKPFALPAIDARIGDLRVRLETPQGPVGLAISGSGRLDAGFRGSVAAVSNGVESGGCRTTRISAVLAVRTAETGPELIGPIRSAAIHCGRTRADALGADVSVRLTPRLDGWRGRTRVGVGEVRAGSAIARGLGGDIAFAGDSHRTTGTVDLHTQAFATADVRGAGASATGRFVAADGAFRYDGLIGGHGLALAPAHLAAIIRTKGRGVGTPVGPLVDQLSDALAAAARSFDLNGAVAATLGAGATQVELSQMRLTSASGVQAELTSTGIGYDAGHVTIGRARANFGGGGLPEGSAVLASTAGQGIAARVMVQPYAAGAARVALGPIRIAVTGDTARIVADATLSGPIAGGRIDGLTLPLDVRWDGRLIGNPGCTPIGFRGLAVSGLTLAPSRFVVCPLAGALVRSSGDGLVAGGRFGAVTLAGALGRTPLAVAATGGQVDLRGFTLAGVSTTIGAAERATRIDVGRLTGGFANGGVAGGFADAGGRIGAVPLRLTDAAGDWRFASNRLTLGGTLLVSDTAAPARFKPLRAEHVAMTLAGDAITANAMLVEPTRATTVANVNIGHSLSTGTGRADIAVSGLAFTETFQPELLTPLTLGVIAEVRGTIDGAGHIAWTPEGVTSTGDFHTDAVDLAAAVGPVTGIAGSIHFDDLLALKSAPGQIATIRTINPGIPVNEGTIRYQTLPDSRVLIEQGDWPFAGGALRLDPTLLDFSQPAERRMTFHVSHMMADQFLQQFDFKNLDATGIFDGVLPMIFDTSGGRIEGGSLTVREGGGTLAYVGEIGQKDLGTWGNIAFQALKSLRYRSLEIVMNGPLAGEMITEVKFAGISQGQGAKSNFLIRRLQRLPFVFNIRIKAPFRGLLDSAQSFYDPKRLVQRNLPALLDEQDKRAPPPIQPPASRIVP